MGLQGGRSMWFDRLLPIRSAVHAGGRWDDGGRVAHLGRRGAPAPPEVKGWRRRFGRWADRSGAGRQDWRSMSEQATGGADVGAGGASVAAQLIRIEDLLQRLQRISLDLTASVSFDDVVRKVIDVLDAPIAAPARALWLRQPGTDALELVAHRGMAAASADRFQRIPLTADLPGAVAVRERRTVISVGPSDAVARFATLHDVVRSTSGFLAIPLLA